MRSRQSRASSTASVRRQARYRRPANSTGPSRSRRSVLHLVRELRGICSNRSAVAWGAPLIRWSDDGAIVLAARPIASSSGTSLGDVLRLLKRHPACRRREVRNVRTWPAMLREKAQAAPTARPKVPMRRRGADCLVRVLKRGNARGATGGGRRFGDGATRKREEPDIQWKALAFMRWHEPYDARVSSPDL